MVSFRIIASALALAAPITAQFAGALATAINTLTTKSSALNTEAQSITLITGLIKFPQIINGFQEIISILETTIEVLEADPSTVADGPDSETVITAFRSFDIAHTALFNTLINKAGLNSILPLATGVAGVLRDDKSALDTFYKQLASTVPSRKPEIDSRGLDLVEKAGTAATAYDGSPLIKRSMRFGRRDMIAAA